MSELILHDVYLGLGSNLGNRDKNLHRAIKNINERIGEVISLSSFYATEPVGFVSDNLFLNAACCVKTLLSPMEVLRQSQIIEKLLGRQRKSVNHTYSDRVIDIDLLMYDDLILNSDSLVLPHPFLHEREFVLYPLAEIAKDIIHPKLGRTIGVLRLELEAPEK